MDESDFAALREAFRARYVDRDGNEYDDVIEWAKAMEGPPERLAIGLSRVVATDGVGFQVSTLFFGVTGLVSGGPYETAIFGERDGAPWGREYLTHERWHTEEEARVGHTAAVQALIELARKQTGADPRVSHAKFGE